MNRLIKFIFVLLCFIPVVWFVGRPGILIDGSDTNFPLDPVGWFNRRMYVWNASSNAGSDFSASTAGTVFHLVQVIPTLLGFSLQATEIISLVFWFSAILLVAYFLARTLLPKSPLLQVLFASIYAINPYVFNTWENAKVSNISLLLSLPLFVNLIISLNQKKVSLAKGLLLSTFFGLLISGAGINPAYFVVFALSFWICAVIHWKSILKSLIVFMVVLGVNAFWIFPTAKFVFGNIGAFGGLEKIGYTNWIDSLSQNTSLYNVLRLQGAWDWYAFESSGQPTYLPYSVNYFYRFPFIAFSLLLPAISMLAYVVYDKKNRLNLFFWGTFLILGVFMSAGTHPPTGTFFRWLLVNHLPFFSLFRSPWYIFTPLIILAYAGLSGIFFEKSQTKFPKLTNLAVLIIFFGNLVYCYPLLTGKIFRPTMPDNFYIKFPSYVFDAQKWLKSVEETLPGRMLSYPPDEIERFKWGYNGIDSILSLLSPVKVMFSPLNAPESPVSQLLREMYSGIRNNEIERVKNLAGKLNIGFIFNKEDQKTLATDLPPAVKTSKSYGFGQWKFYEFPGVSDFTPKIYSPKTTFFSFPTESSAKVLSVLNKNQVMLNYQDTVVNSLPTLVKASGSVVLAENSQALDLADFETQPHVLKNRLIDRDMSFADFTFMIRENGVYKPALENNHLETFNLYLEQGIFFKVELDGRDETLQVLEKTNSYVYFNPRYFESGPHKLRVKLYDRNLIQGGDFEQGEVFEKIGGATFKIESDQNHQYLNILNEGKSAPEPAAKFTVSGFDPSRVYVVKVNYREIYGNVALVEVDQIKDNITYKHVSEGLPNALEWRIYSFYYRPVPTESSMKVSLISPFVSNVFGTKILYDDLVVSPVFTNSLLLIQEPSANLNSPSVDFQQESPVLYKGSITGATGPHVIIFSENYSPDWEFQPDDIKAPAHFSANMYANAWYVDWSPESYKFKLYYRPQTWRYWGLGISVVTIISALLYFIYDKNSKKNR